jgi:DNA-binding transcriptional LysR family regulator
MTVHLDLKRMRYVLEVARAESITSAAETLGVTQSALSRSVAEVEDALGTLLFHRRPRGIQITPAGERFVAGAKRLLGDVDNLVAEVQGGGELVSGRLRIAVGPKGFMDHISRAVKAFVRDYPGVIVEIRTGSTQALCPRLMAGEYDVMVGASGYLRRWRELEVTDLRPLKLAVVVRAGHPLTLLKQPPSEIDILGYPFVIPESVEPIYADVAQRFAHYQLPPFQPKYVVDDTDTAARILGATNAVQMLSCVNFHHIGPKYVVFPDVLNLPPQSIAVAYNAKRKKSSAAIYFESVLASMLSDDVY